jgi:tetratricopeptide (TPR) repeat protein
MNKYIILIIIIAVALSGGCMKAKADKKTEPLPDFDKLWDYNNPDQTEAKFRELLPAAQASGDMLYYGQLLTQIARTQGLQQKFDEAHATLDTVEKMLTDDLVKVKIRYLLERGRVYNSSGAHDKAKPLFLNAYELAEANHEDYYAIDAIHMLQIVEPPEKQLEWAEKAIAMAEKTEDTRAQKWLGPLYNNTGWTYFDLKQFDKAMDLFKKSLSWRQAQNDEEGTRIAQWTIARTYREIEEVEKALEMQKTLEKEREQKSLDPDGYVFEEIAECLLLLERKDEAKPYFKRAYDILSQDEWLVTNQSDRLQRLKTLGE